MIVLQRINNLSFKVKLFAKIKFSYVNVYQKGDIEIIPFGIKVLLSKKSKLRAISIHLTKE